MLHEGLCDEFRGARGPSKKCVQLPPVIGVRSLHSFKVRGMTSQIHRLADCVVCGCLHFCDVVLCVMYVCGEWLFAFLRCGVVCGVCVW